MRHVILALLVTGSCAFAQHGSAGGSHRSAFGGHAGRGGGLAGSPAFGRAAQPQAVIVPYPVFYGGYYSDPSMQSNTPQGAPYGSYYDDTGAYGAPGQVPAVIVNQSFQPEMPNPVIRDYSNAPLPQPSNLNAKPDDQPTIYLIALKDHTILPAVAYWAEGDTLAYITDQGDQNRISLALVDREFSLRLNSDRGVEFHLPPVK